MFVPRLSNADRLRSRRQSGSNDFQRTRASTVAGLGFFILSYLHGGRNFDCLRSGSICINGFIFFCEWTTDSCHQVEYEVDTKKELAGVIEQSMMSLWSS